MAVKAGSVEESEYGTVSEGYSSTYSEPSSDWSYDPGDSSDTGGSDNDTGDTERRRRGKRDGEIGGGGGLLTQEQFFWCFGIVVQIGALCALNECRKGRENKKL